jgi:hypothetical protein
VTKRLKSILMYEKHWQNQKSAGWFAVGERRQKMTLQNYLKLAAEVCSLAEYCVKEISSQLQIRHQRLNFQERLLIGLAIKMYHTFESLVEDAKRERAEAIHHLKTLVESFIYLYWVGEKRGGNKKARIVLAKTCNEKVKFFKNNPDYPDQKNYLQDWESEIKELTKGIEDEWKKFKNKQKLELAKEAKMESYYHRVYRLACESAHVTDLVEYMPLPSAFTINFDRPKLSILWSHVALYYGLNIMCDLLHAGSEFYKLKLDQKISDLKRRI